MGTDSEGQSIEVNVSDEPPGMERVRAVADLLDEAVEVPVVNYKIGLDPILGLLPVGGDAVSAAISLYIVAEGARMGASQDTVLRMLANVVFDAVGGSIPILGSIVDAVFKANQRNVKLLEEEFGE
ncbi:MULTISPECIES: DUF4112 domain-containing protein [Halorussus]|uniref:DUF4112 domain-containing protein n=1 Tax=Halorussus TaxID=1070314 RepID=UPI0020A02103|nr:DUF4112 domain-containing protein [Halorussus vallis]USZ77982.1 DUF4112 domain-containing protein [Halorussus vallis]USZ78014.1 DUF4112 domain-containing protein [Halorussus vallis]